MKFRLTFSLDKQERRIVERGAVALHLIDSGEKYRTEQWSGETKDSLSFKAIHKIANEGGEIDFETVDRAISGLTRLKAILAEMSTWGMKNWGFMEASQTSYGHLARQMGHGTAAVMPLIANPTEFVKHMANLRKTQLLDVEDALKLLHTSRFQIDIIAKFAKQYGENQDGETQYGETQDED